MSKRKTTCRSGIYAWCRLKVSGPYYEDYKTPLAIAPAADAAASPDVAAGSAAAEPLTAAEVQSKVETAVAAVMGDVPGPSQPLVEAGLDSLGTEFPN